MCWTSARFAAPANSVRELEKELCELGEAGLSLRDITYMQTDASRQKEIASIDLVSGKYITNFVLQLVQRLFPTVIYICTDVIFKAGEARLKAIVQPCDRCHKKK